MKKIVVILQFGLMLAVLPVTGFAADFELDRGIGATRGRDVEDWADARDDAGRNTSYNARMYQYNTQAGGSLASAYGNAIVIKTQPGSHVVLNASQINTGNQTVEVSLNSSINNKRYRNVEDRPTYDTDANLYQVQ